MHGRGRATSETESTEATRGNISQEVDAEYALFENEIAELETTAGEVREAPPRPTRALGRAGEWREGERMRVQDMSSVTPDQHSEDDDTTPAAKRRLVATEVVEGPAIRTKYGSLATKAAVQESTRMQLDASPSRSMGEYSPSSPHYPPPRSPAHSPSSPRDPPPKSPAHSPAAGCGHMCYMAEELMHANGGSAHCSDFVSLDSASLLVRCKR